MVFNINIFKFKPQSQIFRTRLDLKDHEEASQMRYKANSCTNKKLLSVTEYFNI